MKFLSLSIENFLAITAAEFNLADRGLVLIQGINHDDSSADSNGAGKSSIADALCWVLFGTTARGVTGDDVINDLAGKGTKVEVQIQDGADTYFVARHRKHKPNKNALMVGKVNSMGQLDDLTKGTDKLTQDLVNKIVGSSLEVFAGAIYAGQEKMPDLPAMTDKNLKLLIEEASGVLLLEEAYREAREDLAKVKATREHLERDRVTKIQRIQWIDGQIAAAQAQVSQWEDTRKNSITQAKTTISGEVAKVRALDQQIAAAGEPALVAAIAECDQKINAVAGENAKFRDLDRAVQQAASALQTAEAEQVTFDNQVARHKRLLADVRHKVGCPCDECGRPLTDSELAAATQAASKKLGEYTDAAEEAARQVAIAQKALQGATETRDAFVLSMTDLSATNAQRASLQAQLTSLQSLKAQRENAAQSAKHSGEQVKQIIAMANPHTEAVQRLQQDRVTTSAEQAAVEQQLQTSQQDLDVAETVVKVFSPAGVRAHILDEVTPFLNQQTAKYLSILSDGNIEATWTTLVANGKGELREKFSIEVTNAKGAKSFAGLSGGEKRKVRVACALALQDLVATRATKPIDLFIGDEIDDALDQAGLERLMQILEEKAKERGSVFVISHNSLRDWISQTVTIEKQNGQTKVTEMVL